MDENLTPEEQQAFNSIMAAITEAPAQQEPAVEEVQPSVEAAQTQQQSPTPQPITDDVSKELLERLIANQEALVQQNKIIQEQTARPQEPQRELTEEEKSIQKLRELAGIDKLEQENEMLKQQLQEIMDMKQEMESKRQQEMEYQSHMSKVQEELSKIKQERPQFDDRAVYDYIMKQPESYRQMLDTPHGWRMVDDILKNMAQPIAKPDNIVTTKSTQPASPNLKTLNEREQDLERTTNILRQLGM